MYTYFFEDGAAWYTVPALVGTIFFLIRLKLMLLGIAGDLDIDPDISDSSEAFHILSIQSIASFLMGFGWGGLGAVRGLEWEGPSALVVAALSGAGMVWLLGLLLKGVADLQSSGNIDLSQTVGKEGEVSSMIPPGGQGRIRLVVSQRLRTFSAVAAPGQGAAGAGGAGPAGADEAPAQPNKAPNAGEEIPSGTRVRVIATNPDNTVTVVRV